jgi:hypothetical protein
MTFDEKFYRAVQEIDFKLDESRALLLDECNDVSAGISEAQIGRLADLRRGLTSTSPQLAYCLVESLSSEARSLYEKATGVSR